MPSPDPTPTTLASDLRRLNWPRTADDLNDLIAQATQRRSVERRLTAARLGRFKPLADWDWDWPTALDRPALERILALDFLDRPDNVLLVGAQGLGKATPDQSQAAVAMSVDTRSDFRSLTCPPTYNPPLSSPCRFLASMKPRFASTTG